MTTIGASMRLLPKGFRTAPYRSTDGAVLVVMEGRMRATVGGQAFSLCLRDIQVLPLWTEYTFEAGEENDVPVVDLHQLSIDLYAERGFCPVPGGDGSASTTGPVGDFFCDDHTHFSDPGSVSIGALVAQAISDLGLPLAAYLK